MGEGGGGKGEGERGEELKKSKGKWLVRGSKKRKRALEER